LGSVIYTFQPAFHAVAGGTYIVQTSTQLPGDQNGTNDAIVDTITVSAGSETISGEAEICSPTSAGLRANTHDPDDAVSWFDSQTATTPIATGIQATTNIIPADKTYYMGLNEVSGSVGPKTKFQFPSGGYNYFQGNFVKFHSDVPLTIASTRLYVGAGGSVEFIVADLADYDSCTGAFSYFEISKNTIDVYPTTPTPSRVPSSVNPISDTGAVFLLNLPVPTSGDHVLIVVGHDSAFLFRNNNILTNPYPMGMPGIFTITGNSAINTSNCKDTTFYQKYYYFLYDTRITLDKCASPRVPIVAQPPTPATITLVGNVLTSNYLTGNQWYIGDSLIAGPAGQQDTFSLRGPGVYKDVISDSVGCDLVATYSTSGDIGLAIKSNPNNGKFKLEFYSPTAGNADIRIIDINGQIIYSASYPNFIGSFSRHIDISPVSQGMYILQLDLGGKKYVKKFMVY
jgi:hypothetical protein